MKVIFTQVTGEDSFHLYISVAGHILVYQRPLAEVIPSIGQSLQQLVKTTSNTMGSPNRVMEEEPESSSIFSQSQPFGIIPEIQKKPKAQTAKQPHEYIEFKPTILSKLDREPDDLIEQIN